MDDMPAPNARRRTFLIGLPVAAAAAFGIFLWPEAPLPEGAGVLDPDEAFARVRSGEVWLIDIRRSDEWALTGIAAGAIPLDMRRDDFASALAEATAADPDRPLAVICARGVRSRRLTLRLHEAGHRRIFDVPEGMLGSRDGPGWLERGLPIDQAPGATG